MAYSVYFMIHSVFLEKPSMAAQNNLFAAFHTMKYWLLGLGLISFLQLEVLPEGYFCYAMSVELMVAHCISLFPSQTCEKLSSICSHPGVTFCMCFQKPFALQLLFLFISGQVRAEQISLHIRITYS